MKLIGLLAGYMWLRLVNFLYFFCSRNEKLVIDCIRHHPERWVVKEQLNEGVFGYQYRDDFNNELLMLYVKPFKSFVGYAKPNQQNARMIFSTNGWLSSFVLSSFIVIIEQRVAHGI